MDGLIFLISVAIGAGFAMLGIAGFYNGTEGGRRGRRTGVVQIACAVLIPTLYVLAMFLVFP